MEKDKDIGGSEDGAPDPDDLEPGTDVKAGEDGSPDDPDAAAVIAGEVTNLTAIKLYCNFIFVFFSQFIFAKLSFSFNPVEGTLLDEDI